MDASADTHAAFNLLDRRVQRQLYAMKWPSLRPIQVDAVKAYLGGSGHLMIMAETAAGKTEAAFLPVLSSIADEPTGSVRALYVGPLKALINDQFARIEDLCSHLEMPVHRWHGDVGATKKDALIKQPGGVLLITPESLESLLVNRTAHLHDLFGGLRAIVIDELHAFLQGERGLHLASLLQRIVRYHDPTQSVTRLLGLSATIGDRGIGQRYLSPDAPDRVEVIVDNGDGTEIRMRLHGYDGHALMAQVGADPSDEDVTTEAFVDTAIAEDLVEHCRGHSNLIFANAKGDIEIMADTANEGCRRAGLPESFLVHHGSLSKEVREDTEERMKSDRPYTAICSSTLEMGIDIGSVRMVGQIGAPWSAASLKQRMGRSGRKPGEARRLRMYADCTVTPESTNPISLLPLELLQSIAVCELVLEDWVEPPSNGGIDLSTLTHQIISTIAERGAAKASDLHVGLCREGPFRNVDTELFARLLRGLGSADIIEQSSDGLLILGLVGEKLRARRDFYAAFASRTEYAVLAGSRVLGTLPLDTLPKTGDHIVFAARRWQVKHVDPERQEVHVEPAKRRERPSFVSAGGAIHHRVLDRMMQVLRDDAEIPYLDAPARDALAKARSHAKTHGLAERRVLAINPKITIWLTWAGTAETRTYEALLASIGIESRSKLVGLVCSCSEADLTTTIRRWSTSPPDLLTLAEHVQPKRLRKYDEFLHDDLLVEGIASQLSWMSPTTDRR
jgi:ATP-dependent Lhr-like helicase